MTLTNQIALPLVSVKHNVDNDGFEMGVMSDGTPYLTASGLAFITGKARSNIITLVSDWSTARLTPRGVAISRLITKHSGDPAKSLHTPITVKGIVNHAISANVCMAIIEYYAFESTPLSVTAQDHFRNLATQSLKEFIYKRTGYKSSGALPLHLIRYTKNRSKIPYTHFSMLNEITLNLIAPLEEAGYTLPDNLIPDISEGRMFCAWLRKNRNVEPNKFPRYEHEYVNGKTVNACLYPIEFMDDFRKHFHEVWLKEKAPEYFKKRDAQALHFIENLALPAPQ